MAGYLPLKMKRKDLDDVNDEFSDFSLSSPARKIRRLDAELPPIMEEEEPEVVPVVFEQSMSEGELSSKIERVGGGPVKIEELASNEERSIVLFKPMNTPLLQSPSNFSFQVSSDLISGFKKDQVLWSNQRNPVVKSAEDEAERRDHENAAIKESWAVVPWVPSQFPPTQNEVSELMETEEMEVATMDIEDNSTDVEHGQGNEFGGTSVGDGLHQWPQQHCVIPQFPQNPSTPIVWYR